MSMNDWTGTDAELLDMLDESIEMLVEELADNGIVLVEETGARRLFEEALSSHAVQVTLREKALAIMQREGGAEE